MLFFLLFSLPLFAAESTGVLQLAPIVILGSDLDKTSTPLVSAPGNYAEQDAKSIRDRAPRSLRSALGEEPNVSFVGNPRPHTELPQIRGLNSKRILVLDEGVRQNFHAEHGGRVFSDYSLLERVEVVKGPWSSLYGSGAMGGVINIRRSNAGDLAARSGKDKGVELALDGGSNASEFGQRLTAFSKGRVFQPLFSYHHSHSNNVKFGDGRKLTYSGNESQDFYSSLGFALSESQFLELKLNQFRRLAREPLNPEGYETVDSQVGDITSTKKDVVAIYRKEGERLSLHFKPYVRETRTEKSRVSGGRNDSEEVQTVGFDGWGNIRRTISDQVQTVTTVGAEFFQDKNTGRRNGGPLSNFPDGKTDAVGLYLQPQVVLAEKWKITPGIRHDRYRSKSVGGGINKGNNTSLKLYGSYEFLPSNLVFAGWGQAFNAPRLQDIYISGLHFPGGTGFPNNFFQANPNLRAEKANTAELGYKGNHNLRDDILFSPAATYFITEAKDFISRDVNISGGTTKLANLDRVRLHGFELSSLLQTTKIGVGLSYGQVRSKNKRNGQPLDDTSADRWAGNLETYLRSFTLGTQVKYVEAQERVPSKTDRTGPYFVEDLYLNYSSQRINGGLRVNNLWNRSYRQHGSLNPDPGRDFRFTASYLF